MSATDDDQTLSGYTGVICVGRKTKGKRAESLYLLGCAHFKNGHTLVGNLVVSWVFSVPSLSSFLILKKIQHNKQELHQRYCKNKPIL